MRNPREDDRDMIEALIEVREDHIARIARITKKGRRQAERWIRF